MENFLILLQMPCFIKNDLEDWLSFQNHVVWIDLETIIFGFHVKLEGCKRLLPKRWPFPLCGSIAFNKLKLHGWKEISDRNEDHLQKRSITQWELIERMNQLIPLTQMLWRWNTASQTHFSGVFSIFFVVFGVTRVLTWPNASKYTWITLKSNW